jgi:hypothetical protein
VSPLAGLFPYRLSGLTILLDVQISNFCADDRSVFDGDWSGLRAQLACFAASPLGGLSDLQATVTATKIDDYGLLRSRLVPQPSSGSRLATSHGVKIVVRTDARVYEVDWLQTSKGFFPVLVCLALVYLAGLRLIDCSLYCSEGCACPRTRKCCLDREREVAEWKNVADETGVSPDPLRLKFWTRADNARHQNRQTKGEAQYFRMLGCEPDWSQTLRKRSPPDFSMLSARGRQLTDDDALAIRDRLRAELRAVVTAETDRTKDNLSIAFEGAREGGESERDRRRLLKRLKFRLDSKAEALGMLTSQAQPHQNLLRAVLLETFPTLYAAAARRRADEAARAATGGGSRGGPGDHRL